MFDYLHILLVIATVTLVIQATRRNMAGSLSVVSVICLVVAVLVLSVRNRSLNSVVEEARYLASKSVEEKGAQLEACTKEVESQKNVITDLETLRNTILGEKAQLEKDIEGLRSEAASNAELSANVEKLNLEINNLRANSDQLQQQLTAAQQEVSSLNEAKASLQANLADVQQKLAAAEAAKAPEAPVQQEAAAPVESAQEQAPAAAPAAPEAPEGQAAPAA